MNQSNLKSLLRYDPETGSFRWLERRKGVRSDLIAGFKMKNGYIGIGIDGRGLYAHRLAWIYGHGEIPDGMEVSHANGDRTDNRLLNLRIGTKAQRIKRTAEPAKKTTINQDGLRRLLRYEPKTGFFFWIQEGHQIKAGQRADAAHWEGYLSVYINGSQHRAHRLAWILMNGEIPDGMDIDHINRDRGDNRISNLRVCPRRLNCQNSSKPRRNNTSGFLGVSYQKQYGKYVATIGHHGKKHTIGRFDTAEEASAAYWSAKRRLHEFCPPTDR